MSTTKIITMDSRSQSTLDDAEITLPVVGGVIADQIFIRPDWPPIGSPDFAAKFRTWHQQHNGRIASQASTLPEAQQSADAGFARYLSWRRAGGEA